MASQSASQAAIFHDDEERPYKKRCRKYLEKCGNATTYKQEQDTAAEGERFHPVFSHPDLAPMLARLITDIKDMSAFAKINVNCRRAVFSATACRRILNIDVVNSSRAVIYERGREGHIPLLIDNNDMKAGEYIAKGRGARVVSFHTALHIEYKQRMVSTETELQVSRILDAASLPNINKILMTNPPVMDMAVDLIHNAPPEQFLLPDQVTDPAALNPRRPDRFGRCLERTIQFRNVSGVRWRDVIEGLQRYARRLGVQEDLLLPALHAMEIRGTWDARHMLADNHPFVHMANDNAAVDEEKRMDVVIVGTFDAYKTALA